VVPKSYHPNATPRLAVTHISEGSWLFRTFLALPAITAIVATAVIAWT